MGYKVKRGTRATNNTIKEMLLGFIRRLVVVGVVVAVGYFLFQFAYDEFPVFKTAADNGIKIIKGFYTKHGLRATLGVIGFISFAVWALGEELKRKEHQEEASKN